jgi:UDP-GlcNAc:undecaprenyl-phosphate/decaprenyl-phosphate GlcNAc-1-phosphate transferase
VTDLVPLLVGAAVAAAMAPGALRTFAENGWTRPNFRGRALPFPGGVVAVAAAVLALGALAALDELAGTSLLAAEPGSGGCAPGNAHCLARRAAGASPALFVLLAGVAFLGLADDLLDAPPRGLRGHARAVFRGRFSTGALKAAGTLALALLALAGTGLRPGEYLLAVLLLVLTTNVFNLLDLRPGRSAKACVVLVAALLLASKDAAPLAPLGPFMGALFVLAAFDLRERTMLGDTGANVLGALAGLWLVLTLGVAGQLVALAIVAALTLYGEVRSLSRAIERIPPLRALDRLGRPV